MVAKGMGDSTDTKGALQNLPVEPQSSNNRRRHSLITEFSMLLPRLMLASLDRPEFEKIDEHLEKVHQEILLEDEKQEPDM